MRVICTEGQWNQAIRCKFDDVAIEINVSIRPPFSRCSNFRFTRAMFIAALLFLLCTSKSLTLRSSNEQVSEFLANVIEHKCQNCDILISNDDAEETIDFPSTFYQFLCSKVPINTVYSLSLKSTRRPIRQGSVHRYGQHCFVSVSHLFNVDIADSLKKFDNIITWRYGTITWKDTDHYIFVTRQSASNSIALSPVTLKIKFKIILEVSNGLSWGWDGAVKSACFYCNNGQPTVMTTKVNPSSSLQLDQLFPDYVENFHGFKIRAAVSSKIKYRIEIYQQKDGKWEGKPGVHTRLIQLCQDKLNFTYELFPSIGGGGSGVKWPNGTWTGSMADILYDNAEFGMVTAQTLQRDELVSFSFPITYDWLTFATGQPQPITTWKKIFWPLDPSVWYCLVPSVIIVIITWYLMWRFIQSREHYVFDLKTTVWYIIAPLLEQDFKYPRTQGLRCFCLFWLFFALIISTAYRSQLVPSLAFPFIQAPPQTFEQLTSSKYKWGLYYLAGAAYSAFRSSTNPTYVKIFRGMEIENDAIHCLIRAIETRFACIIYEGSAVDVVHRSLSDKHGRHPILVAPTTTFFISSCWVMEKRAIFRPNFEKIMHRTMDMGINMRWVELNYRRIREARRENANRTQYTFEEAKDGPQPLELVTFTGPFYVLAFGVVVTAVVFAVEISTLKAPDVLKRAIIRYTGRNGEAKNDVVTSKATKTWSSNYPSAFSTLNGTDEGSTKEDTIKTSQHWKIVIVLRQLMKIMKL